MKTRPLSYSLLSGGIACFAAALFATYEGVHFVTARRHLRVARQEVTTTRLKIPARPAPSSQDRRQPAAAATAEPPPVSADFVARLESLKPKATGRAPGGVPLIFPEDLFEYHAPLKAAYLEAVKGQQWVEYGPFYANARMSAAEIEQFEAAGMDRALALLEMRKTAEARGVDPEDPAIKEIGTTANRVRQDKLRSLLGTERFQQLETYEEEIRSRRMLLGLHHLVSTSFYTEEPITVTQMNQIAALATELGMFDVTKSNNIPDAFNQLAIRSAAILTQRQLEVFDLMLDFNQYSLARWQMNNPEAAKNN